MSAKKKRSQAEFDLEKKAHEERLKVDAEEVKAALPESARYLVKSLLECYRALEGFNSTLYTIDDQKESQLTEATTFLMDDVREYGDRLVGKYGLEPVASWEQRVTAAGASR